MRRNPTRINRPSYSAALRALELWEASKPGPDASINEIVQHIQRAGPLIRERRIEIEEALRAGRPIPVAPPGGGQRLSKLATASHGRIAVVVAKAGSAG